MIVWQNAMDLVVEVYKIADLYPKSETYGLTFQTRKSAVSMPSNIAEGKRRNTEKDRKRFYNIAFASGAELETQIELAKRLKFVSIVQFVHIDGLLDEVMRMLNTLTIPNRE